MAELEQSGYLTRDTFMSIARSYYDPAATDIGRNVAEAFDLATGRLTYTHPDLHSLAAIIVAADKRGQDPFPEAVAQLAHVLENRALQYPSTEYYRRDAALLRQPINQQELRRQ